MLKSSKSLFPLYRTIAFTLSTGYLYLLYYLYLRETVALSFLTVTLLISVLTGILIWRWKLKVIPALVVIFLVPWIIRWSFHSFTGVLNYFFRGAGLQQVFFDIGFWPLFLPFIYSGVACYLGLRYPRKVFWIVLGNSILFLLLLWPQGGYKITIVGHPSLLGVSVILFVIFQMIQLMLQRRRSPRKSLLYSLVVLPMILILFLFLLGYYNEGTVAEGGGLLKSTFFRFDFSKYLTLESEISLSDDLVLLMRKEGPPANMLLRRMVLTGYRRERGFFQDSPPGDTLPPTTVPNRNISIPRQYEKGRHPVKQEYFLFNFDPGALLGLNEPFRVIPLRRWDDSSFLRIYQVDSLVLTRERNGGVESDLFFSSGGAEVSATNYYTACDEDDPILDLARQITVGIANRYGKVRAIEEYLQEHYWYSLTPGVSLQGDQLHHFLFDSKKGYCSYFAFAMTLMCRLLEIPARVAIGFYVDPMGEVMNFYPVRADMAHAWVEVFFPEYGWIEFDPTSTRLAPGEEYAFGAVDAVELTSLIEEILDNREGISPVSTSPEELFTGEKESPFRSGLMKIAARWYLILPFLYLLFMVLRILNPYLRVFFARGFDRQVRGLFQADMRLLLFIGYKRDRQESVQEFCSRLETEQGIPLEQLCGLYLEAQFREDFPLERKQTFSRVRKEYYRALRKRVPFHRWLRGFLFPFNWNKRDRNRRER